MESYYLKQVEAMEDAELRREYSNLLEEGTGYRYAKSDRHLLVSKIILVDREMRKRNI